MRINCKQTNVKCLFSHKIFLVLLIFAAVLVIIPVSVFAPTRLPDKVLSDKELSDISGQSFFTLTELSEYKGSNTVIRLDLGVNLIMNAHIDSWKMGYYANDTGDTSEYDIDVTNYFWGSPDYSAGIPAVNLTWNGVFLEFGFQNIDNNNGSRVLNYLELGSANVVGQVTGTLNSVNGLFAETGTGQNGGVLFRQTASGRRTVYFSNELLSFVFASKYSYRSSTNLHGIFQKIPNYTTS